MRTDERGDAIDRTRYFTVDRDWKRTGFTPAAGERLGFAFGSTIGKRAAAARARPWWQDALRRRMLAGADAVAVLLGASAWGVASGEAVDAAWLAGGLPAWLVLAKLHGLYDRDHRALRHLTVDELPAIFMWSVLGAAATVLVAAAVSNPPKAVVLLIAWGVLGTAAFGLRAVARGLWRRTVPPERTLVIGDERLVAITRRRLELFRDVHVEALDPDRRADVASLRRDLSRLDGVDRVVVATSVLEEAAITELVAACREKKVKLDVIPPGSRHLGTAVRLSRVADLPVVDYSTWDVSRSTMLLKRALDLAVASAALVVLSPLLLLVGLAVKLGSPGPILFVQRRAGMDGRSFAMLKFRTMVDRAEDRLSALVRLDELQTPMFKLRRDPRVTRVGGILRRFSLDELPQLVNVLRGEMSLVGPRPEELALVERYRPEHRFRLAVKPGLTGPMQVFGRGELTFDERLSVEREYIDNLSLARDLRILAMTLPAVIAGKGAF